MVQFFYFVLLKRKKMTLIALFLHTKFKYLIRNYTENWISPCVFNTHIHSTWEMAESPGIILHRYLCNWDKITPDKYICHLQLKTSLHLIEFTVLFSLFITSLNLMLTFYVPRRGTGKGQVKNKFPPAIFAELFLVNSQTHQALISSFICTCLLTWLFVLS